MLTLYYNPRSPNARRVWLTLLEKNIPFEPIILKLDGDQTNPEFLQINPFHHIPVLVDDGFRVIESLAIMDYLEAKYPDPPLLPKDPKDLATVRMVQLITANELFSEIITLIYESADSPQFETAIQRTKTGLNVFAELLGDRPYFGNHSLTLGDIVAGTALPLLPHLGVSLDSHPTLHHWLQRVMERPVWQTAALSDTEVEEFKRRVKVLVKLRRRQWTQKSQQQKDANVSA